MKKHMNKVFSIVAICSFVVLVATVFTTNCVSWIHEPEMPEELK